MAAATVRAEFTVVDVIGAMAIGTAIAGFPHRRQRTAVAALAGNIQVGSVQFEICLNIVIEQPQVPGNRVVTGLTVVLEYTVVRIIFEMTADTFAVRIAEQLRVVTGIAFDIAVLTQQREARQIVIVEGGIFPLGFIVAVIALLTDGPAMWFIVLVARRALCVG